jgi:hypothetical protein
VGATVGTLTGRTVERSLDRNIEPREEDTRADSSTAVGHCPTPTTEAMERALDV